jgi:dipeptidyl aminopeptidase/acylaminoacyl peptidase
MSQMNRRHSLSAKNNDRGSYGQGEKFTQANRREWGFGDLDDLVAGVDAVVKRFPIDSDRVGVLGWSYGGSTSMMAVTRTHRFRAAVAGAGAVNMQSYYGQNSINKWMIPYFGATVYDDPAAYMRCSAISYIKNAKTPTLILVGELDGEAPPEQSLEFWHALKELGVPTQLVIYPDEGHSFFKPEDRTDLTFRTFEWFEKYMGAQ